MEKLHAREHWRTKLGFIFATSGSAIGLGTLWKLPYLIGQNGGGAFILLFLVFTLCLGTPLFVGELVLGKISQGSVVKTFSTLVPNHSLFPIAGWLALIATFLIAGWYGVVSGWSLQYLLMALADSFRNKDPAQLKDIFLSFRSSGLMNVLWQLVFIGLTCLILAKGLQAGIERFSKILFPLLFIFVLALLGYSMALPGFSQAFQYILYPDFSKLGKSAIIEALGLALFALSLGQGIMVTYGSYLNQKQNIMRTALIVSISIVAISVMISLMIFPMIFSFGFAPESGEGLLFITLPFVTEQLPGSMAIASVFFILLFFAALTSYIGQLEVLVSSFMDTYGLSRKRAVQITAVGCFLVGLPTALMYSDFDIFPNWNNVFHMTFLETNYVLINWILILFSLLVCVMVGYFVPAKLLKENLNQINNPLLFWFWHMLMRFIVPVALVFIIVHRVGRI